MSHLTTKKNFQIFSLIIVFIFSLKYFQSTPFETLFFQAQAFFLGIVLVFLMLFVFTKLIKRRKFDKMIFYYLLLIVTIPFYSAYRASTEFGQPFIYGVLAERTWLLLGTSIWLYYVLITKKISFSTMESAFVFMAWVSLFIFTIFVLTFDPNQLQSSEEIANFVHLTEDRGLRFKFQKYFITFGSIYYFVKYMIDKNAKDLIYMSFFLGFVFFVIQGRFYILAILLTYTFYLIMNYSMSRLFVIVIKTGFVLFVGLLILQIIMPDYLDRMSYLFSQMFTVLAGQESMDSSANARIFASLIVFEYFEMHPMSVFWGTGRVSHQWDGGYDSIFGYFYPSDIGVLGGIFMYGAIGFIVLYLIPFIFSINVLRKLPSSEDVFIVTFKYLLVYALIASVQASFYFTPIRYLIPLLILYAFLKMQWQDKIGKKSIN
ncbi:hypothetical protein [Sulfurimonas diazotrophicus]|uniref:O-antigen polysaccharide polymerase Wzy n=1 Tax=Sulfurimonas diazotrophicus TaxID=3131939 RepID=A0ABZ3H8G4_9BACT